MNRGAPAANMMVLYAIVMMVAGLVAFALAPEGANALTALIVPTACGVLMIVCGLLSRLIDRKRTLGMIGIHVGLVLPLLFAGVIGMRAMKTGEAVAAYRAADLEYLKTAPQPEAATVEDAAITARAAFFDERGAPDHDKSYLRNTLWFLTGASLLAFVLILLRRPKKEDRV